MRHSRSATSRNETRLRWMGMAAGALLAVGCGLGPHLFTWGGGLVRLSYDLLTVASPHVPADEVVMVHLDEESHRVLEQPFNAAWDRAIHAGLIHRLTDAGARAVVFDIVFTDPNPLDPEGDQLLAEAIGRHGKVILAADHFRIGPKDSRIDMPFDLVRDAAAGIGSAEVIPDRDLIIRIHTPPHSLAGFSLPSLSHAAARLVEAPPLRDEGKKPPERWLRYYGPADFLPGVSYHEALDPERTPDAVFKDKVVFVGARILTRFSGERKDEYRTPYTLFSSGDESGIFVSGVEVQATAFLNLWRGDWLRRWSAAQERAVLVVAGILLGAGLVRCRPFPAAGVAVLAAVVTALSSYGLFRELLLWFPWVIVLVMILAALSWSVLFNTVQLYVQKRLIEQTLAIYLPPNLVRKFARNPQLLQPGAQKETLTILFTDIEGFTSISEGMDSDELAGMMNGYFEGAVSGCIHPCEGTVAKYLGDAILAFWNAPDRQPDHAWRACQAAMRFRRQLETSPTIRGRKLVTRIGIHTGVANVGNFGSTQRVDYTVLGENVNLASRLEGLNKHLGTRTLLSGETQAEVGDKVLSRRVGRFRLKGFQKPVDVHELIGEPSEAGETRPWRDAFATALRCLCERDWAAAGKGFRRTLELKPEDGPSRFYLERIPELETQSLPPDWEGEIELEEK